MAHSDPPNNETSSTQKSSNLIPAAIIFFVLATIAGILFYFNSGSDPSFMEEPVSDASIEADTSVSSMMTDHEDNTAGPTESFTKSIVNDIETEQAASPEENGKKIVAREPSSQESTPFQSDSETQKIAATATSSIKSELSPCDKAAENIRQFYLYLDQQEHIKSYELGTTSEDHFIKLILKLLDTPPQVTRETDDLYTILKNTAHFFRISGKENIMMLKGILDSERNRLEDLLADYYFLVTSPDCRSTPYGENINQNSLYEYGCFFLNTMGGRLYLFRRDSLSRMVVTYYAILLINNANELNNNHHGLHLKPAINMLIAEMEGSGASLQKQEIYLDRLYELKEKYQ